MYGYQIADDPIVRCMERTGMPPWQEPDSMYVCPICGGECETIYIDKQTRRVIGCDECIEAEEVWNIGNYEN